MKPMTLELGGKSPQIVFADADLTLAPMPSPQHPRQCRQACVAGSRIIVEQSVTEPLIEAILSQMATIRPGPTWDEDKRLFADHFRGPDHPYRCHRAGGASGWSRMPGRRQTPRN